MNYDDINRILASEQEITPSPEFLASVMSAVTRQAGSLPPLEFPWIRALPGFLAAIVAVAAAIWHAIGILSDPATITAFNVQVHQVGALVTASGLQWIALAVGVTIISIALSSSLVDGRNYALRLQPS